MTSDHWNRVWSDKDPATTSWFEAAPAAVALIVAHTQPDDSIVDVGGGASTLVDGLLAADRGPITVLDVSGAALEIARRRLGVTATCVDWVVADVTRWHPATRYALWHDRAVLHFLTDDASVAAYARVAADVVRPGGIAIVATFADDGPEQCSDLAVRRYTESELSAVFGDDFVPESTDRFVHVTPWGAEQRFVRVVLRRSVERSGSGAISLPAS